MAVQPHHCGHLTDHVNIARCPGRASPESSRWIDGSAAMCMSWGMNSFNIGVFVACLIVFVVLLSTIPEVLQWVDRRLTRFYVQEFRHNGVTRYEVCRKGPSTFFGKKRLETFSQRSWAMFDAVRRQYLYRKEEVESELMRNGNLLLVSRVVWGTGTQHAGHDQGVNYVIKKRSFLFFWKDEANYRGPYYQDAVDRFEELLRMRNAASQITSVPGAASAVYLNSFVKDLHTKGIDLEVLKNDEAHVGWTDLITLVEVHFRLAQKEATLAAEIGFDQIIWHLCQGGHYQQLVQRLRDRELVSTALTFEKAMKQV